MMIKTSFMISLFFFNLILPQETEITIVDETKLDSIITNRNEKVLFFSRFKVKCISVFRTIDCNNCRLVLFFKQNVRKLHDISPENPNE